MLPVWSEKSQTTQVGGISRQQVEANTNHRGNTQLHLRPRRAPTNKRIKFQGKYSSNSRNVQSVSGM